MDPLVRIDDIISRTLEEICQPGNLNCLENSVDLFQPFGPSSFALSTSGIVREGVLKGRKIKLELSVGPDDGEEDE